MLQALFFSDLHLSSMNDPRAGSRFFAFSRCLKGENCSHLFLLGDIFDLWIGDHAYFREAYAPIIDEIQRLVSEKVDVHYFEGNHDLYLKSFWDGRLGVESMGAQRFCSLARTPLG